jgi:hypothetical protein
MLRRQLRCRFTEMLQGHLPDPQCVRLVEAVTSVVKAPDGGGEDFLLGRVPSPCGELLHDLRCELDPRQQPFGEFDAYDSAELAKALATVTGCEGVALDADEIRMRAPTTARVATRTGALVKVVSGVEDLAADPDQPLCTAHVLRRGDAAGALVARNTRRGQTEVEAYDAHRTTPMGSGALPWRSRMASAISATRSIVGGWATCHQPQEKQLYGETLWPAARRASATSRALTLPYRVRPAQQRSIIRSVTGALTTPWPSLPLPLPPGRRGRSGGRPGGSPRRCRATPRGGLPWSPLTAAAGSARS